MKKVSRSDIIRRYQTTRAFTQQLCKPLEIEDFVIQSMPDVSPTKWHLAHTSWFFETFMLKPELSGYQTPNELYNYLFNSYYNAIGDQFPRPNRGLLGRPTVAQVFEYRQHVDQEMHRLLESLDDTKLVELASFIDLGLNHEQQHQELMLSDLKHVLFQNPLYPTYSSLPSQEHSQNVQTLNWISYPGGKSKAGFAGSGFSFDNETPEHEVLTQSFELTDRLVTNGEYLTFVEDNGYTQPQLWLSDGWVLINKENWQAPLYWIRQEGHWFEFTLNGLQPLDHGAPVSHISYYEADAYANWSGARLPSEFEWEVAARDVAIEGNFIETGNLHPVPASASTEKGPKQMFGDVWEWTQSPYVPFPGFKAAAGAVGEYNGKFMASQMVLKGGSCASSKNHLRASYRNFFYPHSRWQFMGLRLAKNIE